MTPDMLAEQIAGTQALTDKPFGVNLITMHPQLDDLIRVTLEAKVGHVVLAGGIPPGSAVKAVKDGGAKLVAFAPALSLARRLVRSGADAIVIEGSEAGGHIGPVSLTVLAQEILPHLHDVPVFVAGGLGRGRGDRLLSWRWAPSGVQLGTMFAAATELIAHAKFKKAFIRANARDAMPSVELDPRLPVIPVRGLVNQGTKRFLEYQAETRDKLVAGELTRDEAQLLVERLLGRRAAPGGDRWRCRVRFRHGRPVGRAWSPPRSRSRRSSRRSSSRPFRRWQRADPSPRRPTQGAPPLGSTPGD